MFGKILAITSSKNFSAHFALCLSVEVSTKTSCFFIHYKHFSLCPEVFISSVFKITVCWFQNLHHVVLGLCWIYVFVCSENWSHFPLSLCAEWFCIEYQISCMFCSQDSLLLSNFWRGWITFWLASNLDSNHKLAYGSQPFKIQLNCFCLSIKSALKMHSSLFISLYILAWLKSNDFDEFFNIVFYM